jgi:hypothetical protein
MPIIAQLSIGRMRVVRMSRLLVLSVSFRATATVAEGSTAGMPGRPSLSGQMRTRASTPEISERRSFRRAKSATELQEAIARSTSRLNKGSPCQSVTARLTADA